MVKHVRSLTLLLALAPAIALAAPQGGAPGRAPGARPGEPGAGPEHAEKRLRIARTVGLAEALDLDEAGALRVRDTLARFDARRAPLRKQARDAMAVLREAARGDAGAAGQVDGALSRLADARAQLQQVNAELFAQLTQGMSPDKKARAALFLARFQERAGRMQGMGPGPGAGAGHGPMRGFGPRGGMRGDAPRPGPAEGPALSMADGGEPDVDDWFVDEQ
jgi:hypothetical protein